MQHIHWRTAFGLSLALATIAWGATDGNRRERIDVVPAPGRVAIDGSLKAWDLSGQLECAFSEKLRPQFTVQVAAMYDSEALYIGAHFVDDTPLLNKHDPAVEPDKGWAGDALQIRLNSDPAQPLPLPPNATGAHVCHLTFWQYTDQQLPVLHIAYGMDYHGARVLTGRDAGVAFRADPDGKGYTLTARVPWERLRAPRPLRAGDRIAFVVQPFWSDGSGWKQVASFNDVIRQAGFSFQNPAMWGEAVFAAHGNLPRESRPKTLAEQQLPLTMSLPLPDKKATTVSAALYNAEGVMVRTLLAVAAPQKATVPVRGAQIQAVTKGALQIAWDGLDDEGKPLPPGSYTGKTLAHRGVGQKYVASVHSAGRPPWRTDDGTGAWGGDHGPPIAAAADDHQVYLGWTLSEAGPGIIAVGPDGQKRWGQHPASDVGGYVTALASDGQVIYMAQDGKGWGGGDADGNKAGVVGFDAATGKPVNFPFGKRALLVSQWPDDKLLPEQKPFERQSVHHPQVPRKRFWERLRDHDFGPQQVGLNFLGVAVANGRLYASLFLEDKVVAFDIATGNRVAEWNVARPAGIAVAADGDPRVISGKRIVRLAADGAVHDVVTTGLSAPYGLALDRAGNLHVSDCGDAMQVKVFDPAGQQVRTLGQPGGRPWVGRYEPNGLLMPTGIAVDRAGKTWVCEMDDTPRRVSVWQPDGRLAMDLLGASAYAVESAVDPANPTLAIVHNTAFAIDYKRGTTKPLSTLIRPQMRGLAFAPDYGIIFRSLHFRHVNGRTYAVHMGRGALVIYLVTDDAAGMIAEPVAALGPVSALTLHGFVQTDLLAAHRTALWQNPGGYMFRWTDANGDRLVQDDEWVFTKVEDTPSQAAWGTYWGGWVDDDLTIWNTGRGILRIPVTEWRGDVPVYPRPEQITPLFVPQDITYIPSLALGATNGIFALEQRGGDTLGNNVEWAALSKYTLDGRRVWAYRRIWPGFGLEGPLAAPGDVVGAMRIIGTATLKGGEQLLAVNGYYGQFNVLDGDGLWVAALCKDTRYGPRADQDTVWPENFSGYFYRHRDNKKVYLMAGDTDARVWEVTGLESLRKKQFNLSLSSDDYAAATRVVSQTRAAGEAKGALRLRRLSASPQLDGHVGDWDLATGVTLEGGAGRQATVALAYDAQQLYVAGRVQDTSPMVNSGKDPTLLFKTGDTCDVMLATDPHADPHRTKPVAGDVRLLLSVSDGKPVAVLYLPVARNGEQTPQTFVSPVATETMDRVVVLPDAQVAFQRTATGYTFEAAVPLATLGFTPTPGLTTKGDVGVLFSDEGGSRTVLRCYYFNKNTGVINDIPTEARLTPADWGPVSVE